MDWLKFENEIKLNGFNFICGADEAGRGPLAGPVCAAAVILPQGCILDEVNDSKKLTAKKRDRLFNEIKACALSYSIKFIDIDTIEKINILQASLLAMKMAIESLETKADFALIDGNFLPELKISSKAIIKGDSLSESIAAASILAKVSRDRKMLEYDEKYPEYGFALHKGYGTKLHIENILKYGPCPIHRKSFLTKILKSKG